MAVDAQEFASMWKSLGMGECMTISFSNRGNSNANYARFLCVFHVPQGYIVMDSKGESGTVFVPDSPAGGSGDSGRAQALEQKVSALEQKASELERKLLSTGQDEKAGGVPPAESWPDGVPLF